MQAPLDRTSGQHDALGVEAGDITFAALLDRHAAEEPITDDMVRRACLRMESAQAWPFATAPDDDASDVEPSGTLARLFRFRR